MKRMIVLGMVVASFLWMASCKSEISPFGTVNGVRLTVSANNQGSDGLAFVITIRNEGFKPAVLNFTSSQVFDIEVKDEIGVTVWKWSFESYFLYVMSSIELGPGEVYTREVDWDLKGNDRLPLPPGSYRALAYTTNYPKDQVLYAEARVTL